MEFNSEIVQQLIETNKCPICLINVDGHIVHSNLVFRNLTAELGNENGQSSFISLFSSEPQDTQQIIKKYFELATKGIPSSISANIVHPKPRIIDLSIKPLKGNNGKVELIAVSFEVKPASQPVPEDVLYNRQILDLIFKNIPDSLMLLNNEKKIIYINNSFEPMFGESVSKYLGKGIFELNLPESILDKFNGQLSKARKQSEKVEMIYGLSLGFLMISVIPLISDSNDENGFLLLIRNVNELVERSREAESTKLKYKNLVNHLPDIIIRIDKNKTINFINNQIKMTGMPIGALIHKNLDETPFFGISPLIKEVFKSRQMLSEPFSFRDKQVELQFQVTVVPEMEDGKMQSALVLFRDETNMKKAQKQLKNIREFIMLSETVPDIVWSANAEGQITFINKKWFIYSGKSEKETYQHALFDLVPEPYQKNLKENWIKASLENQEFKQEHMLACRDGNYRWHLTRAVPMVGNNGEIINWFGSMTDIHEQKLAEESLALKENKLSYIINTAPSPIIEFSAKTFIITNSNQQFFKLTGYTKDGLHELRALDLFEGELKQHLASLLSSKSKYHAKASNLEGILKTKSGEERWVLCNYKAYDTENDKLVTLILNDINTRKHIEEKIRENEESLRLALESGEMGFWKMDVGSNSFTIDEQECRLLGLPTKIREIGLDSFVKFIHPDDRSGVLKLAKDTLEMGKVYNSEYRYLKPNGDIRWLKGRGKPIPDENGKIKSIIGINFDITEQKQAEAKLLESEDRLYKALMNAPIPMAMVAEDGELILVNDVCLEITGYKRDELKNVDEWARKAFRHYSAAKAKDGVFQLFNLSRHIDEGEMKITTKEGNERVWHFFTSPLGEGIDGRKLIISMAVDVTESKRIQSALSKSEERFRTIAQNVPQIIWTAKPNGYKDFFNQLWYDYTGLKKLESIGSNWIDAIHPDDREVLSRFWMNSLHHEETFNVEIRIRSAKDKYGWFWCKVVPVKDNSGKINEWIGTFTDINEQKKIQHLIQEKFEEFEVLANNIEHHVWIEDVNHVPIFLNSKWYDYTNMHPHESKKPDWREKYFDTTLNFNRAALGFKNGGYSKEVRIKDKNGHYRWFLTRIVPLYKHGEIFKWLGTNTDIHQQKTLEQQKGEFMNIASHELKTPLTTTKGYLQLARKILDNVNNERLNLFMDKALDSVNRLNSLVEDLLDVSRIESGKMQPFQFNPLCFKEFVQEIIQRYEISTTRKINFKSESDKFVLADKMRLEQVIDNLISNAIKYSPPDSQIDIRIGENKQSKMVYFDIKDYGDGIDKDKLDKIFTRFYRVTNNETTSGLGLGLYISKEIVKRHNGNIWAESEKGAWSKFCVALPYDEAE